MVSNNQIVHFEFMGADGDQMNDFYAKLFGWKSEPVEGFDGYNMVAAEQAGIGGAVGKGNENMPNYLTVYIQVPDVDKHLAMAEANGGKTVVPRTVVPGTVTFGLFNDPAGNMVGVVEEETPPA